MDGQQTNVRGWDLVGQILVGVGLFALAWANGPGSGFQELSNELLASWLSIWIGIILVLRRQSAIVAVLGGLLLTLTVMAGAGLVLLAASSGEGGGDGSPALLLTRGAFLLGYVAVLLVRLWRAGLIGLVGWLFYVDQGREAEPVGILPQPPAVERPVPRGGGGLLCWLTLLGSFIGPFHVVAWTAGTFLALMLILQVLRLRDDLEALRRQLAEAQSAASGSAVGTTRAAAE